MLAALPTLLTSHPEGPALKFFAIELGADMLSIRRGATELNRTGRADLMRRENSRELFLVPLKYRKAEGRHLCAACGALFDRPKKKRYTNSTYYSDRRTCSRSCHSSLGWKPENNTTRRAALSAAQSRPEALERLARHNQRRWAKSGERERMSEQNRREWADPVKAARRAQSIRSVQRRPTQRALYSAIRKEWWRNPEMRQKMIDAAKKAKNTPEYKAYFSELCRQRWRDPEWRKKWLRAARENGKKGAVAIRGRKQSQAQVAARVAATKTAKQRRRAAVTDDAINRAPPS